ncbi:MAG: transporter substrate-binding domain-containing protein [Bacteroidales bacterium]
MTTKQPLFTMKDNNGKVIGYEVELAEMLAKSMEVQLTIVEIPFSELLKSLEEDKIDMVMSGMTMTTKRNIKSAFVGPHMISGKSILTKSPSFSKTDDAEDLNSSSVQLLLY